MMYLLHTIFCGIGEGKGVGRVVSGAVVHDERCGARRPGFDSPSGQIALSKQSTFVRTVDGVPLTPMSSHCCYVKEPYYSAGCRWWAPV